MLFEVPHILNKNSPNYQALQKKTQPESSSIVTLTFYVFFSDLK